MSVSMAPAVSLVSCRLVCVAFVCLPGEFWHTRSLGRAVGVHGWGTVLPLASPAGGFRVDCRVHRLVCVVPLATTSHLE